jgi:hypothetical protein
MTALQGWIVIGLLVLIMRKEEANAARAGTETVI